MWFVFPQVAGLGHSPTAHYYAISCREEAEVYLAHPMLGPRLIECAGIVAALDESDPVAVFGHIDAIKLRSSVTLFAAVAPDQPVFQAVIDKYFDGKLDEATTSRLCRLLSVVVAETVIGVDLILSIGIGAYPAPEGQIGRTAEVAVRQRISGEAGLVVGNGMAQHPACDRPRRR